MATPMHQFDDRIGRRWPSIKVGGDELATPDEHAASSRRPPTRASEVRPTQFAYDAAGSIHGTPHATSATSMRRRQACDYGSAHSRAAQRRSGTACA